MGLGGLWEFERSRDRDSLDHRLWLGQGNEKEKAKGRPIPGDPIEWIRMGRCVGGHADFGMGRVLQ